MSQSKYDTISDFYVDFVAQNVTQPDSALSTAKRTLLSLVGPVEHKTVCDLGCGEGHLARLLATQGAHVTGVDISAKLLDQGRAQATLEQIIFIQDDAQTLASCGDQTFDLVVSNLALMDIPDLQATYAVVYRVLRPKGRFVFSITHPCFQSPHMSVEPSTDNSRVACRVTHYAEEGFWRSTNQAGVRGQVGAHHRTLATYLNSLINVGFTLEQIEEPTLPIGDYDKPHSQLQMYVPSLLVVSACLE